MVGMAKGNLPFHMNLLHIQAKSKGLQLVCEVDLGEPHLLSEVVVVVAHLKLPHLTPTHIFRQRTSLRPIPHFHLINIVTHRFRMLPSPTDLRLIGFPLPLLHSLTHNHHLQMGTINVLLKEDSA